MKWWPKYASVPTDEETRWLAAVASAIAKERAHRDKMEAPVPDPALVLRIATRGHFLRRKKSA